MAILHSAINIHKSENQSAFTYLRGNITGPPDWLS